MREVFIPKAIMLLAPIILFILMSLFQTCYHYLTYKAPGGRLKYEARGDYTEISEETSKALLAFTDPMGHTFIPRDGALKIIHQPESVPELHDLRFEMQNDLIYGPLMAAVGSLKGYRAQGFPVAIMNDQVVYHSDPALLQMLIDLEPFSVIQLNAVATSFALSYLGLNPSTNPNLTLQSNQIPTFNDAKASFIIEVLRSSKPTKVAFNEDLGFWNFARFSLTQNLLNNSADIFVRSRSVRQWQLLFTFLSYFLLAIQASVLASWWYELLPKR